MRNSLFLTVLALFFIPQFLLAQAPAITRGPYLQVLTPTSVVVRWRTDQPVTGRAWVGLSTLSNSVSETQPTTEHVLSLTGLQPNTKYLYAVGYDNTQQVSGADYYVKTARSTGDTGPVRIWALGDFGCGLPNQMGVYQAFKNATATRPADLWLWLGDNAYTFGQDAEYQQYVFPVYANTLRNTPLFITPGNHDYADGQTNFNIAYYNSFSFPEKGEAGGVPSGSKSYHSANYGNIHFITLDSQGRPDGQYRLYDTTSAQVEWLKKDLMANKQPWTIVIFHHPPYSKGGHNSDTEESMKLIRENLTTILERHGVDLVLNGHSHIYERTYRIKNLTGLAATYDKNKNLVEETSGRYDGSANSCPILTKGKGTIYVVNGSGGQLGGITADFPHPATVYNQTNLGGSMLLDVADNRLDAQFIASDGSVLDKFTIMKNVNKIASITTEFADTLQFSASWPGSYKWSGGQTSRTIRYVADKAGEYSVTATDEQNCLVDRFTVTTQQPPKLTARSSGGTSVCAGSSFAVTATPENTTKAAGWQYDVLLSDASGNFTTEQIVGSGSLSSLKAALPASLSAGSGYRLRVRPRNVSYAQLVASDAFSVKIPPTATLAGSTTVLQGTPVSLTLSFTGDGPWKGTLSEGTTFSSSATPTLLTVQPAKSTVYSIKNVENSCGSGSSIGQAVITILLPTATDDPLDGHLRVFPNPAHDVVHIELKLPAPKDVHVQLTNLNGQAIFQKNEGMTATVTETVPMPSAHGTYLLTVKLGDSTLTRKIVRQ